MTSRNKFSWDEDDIVVTVAKYDPSQERDHGGRWTKESLAGPDPVTFLGQRAMSELVPPLKAAHQKSFNATLGREPTEGELKAVREYTEFGYIETNRVLRKAMPIPVMDTEITYQERLETNAKSVTQGLDSLFVDASLDRDLTVYRRLSPRMADQLVGVSEVTDLGFVSTSVVAPAFGGRYVRIELPKGSRALPVAHISIMPLEREIILNRGQTFSVTRVDNEFVLRPKP